MEWDTAGASLWPLCGEQPEGWSQVLTKDNSGLDAGDGRREKGGLDLRYLLELDQIGIGDDLDIGIKGREDSKRRLHLYHKHLGGSWCHSLRNGNLGERESQEFSFRSITDPTAAALCPVRRGCQAITCLRKCNLCGAEGSRGGTCTSLDSRKPLSSCSCF